MAIQWTVEQVAMLAPDAATLKAGRVLSSPVPWSNLGEDDRALWGDCKGSAKTPYHTQVDLSEPAFHCSCPSRKFPCKHGMGLLLLYVNQSQLFTTHQPPMWVIEWLAKRDQNAAKRANREAKPVNEKAQAKRTEQRQKTISAGLEDLSLWLHDIMRQGLIALQGQPPSFWEDMANRMGDAQTLGVRARILAISQMPMSGEGWSKRVLAALGQLHLLVEGYQHLAQLTPGQQADIYTVLGWSKRQENLLQQPTVMDQWVVLGKQLLEEEVNYVKSRTQRTWLQGLHTQRPALILDFAYNKEPLPLRPLPGSCIEASLKFYPSAFPLRAMIMAQHAELATIDPPTTTIYEALTGYAAALAANPWLSQYPMTLRAVVPVQQVDTWWLREETGTAIPISLSSQLIWKLSALSGGHPIIVFGEWNGQQLWPCSVWNGEQLVTFS